MYIKNFSILAAFTIVVMCCGISKNVKTAGFNFSNAALSPSATPRSIPPESKAGQMPVPEAFIGLLAKSAGKYPADIKLIENPKIRNRLKKLLGKDFADLRSNWNVEMPIEISGDVFKAEACEAHNCGANRYIIFVDLKSANFNVFHVLDNVPKTYFEKGEIDLPSKFADRITGDE